MPAITEAQIQCSIVQYLNYVSSCCYFHIPNGGYRNPREAQKLQRMGVKRGVPDLFLAQPNDHFSGLWVELKKPGGSVSKVQKEVLCQLATSGYAVTVIDSLDTFVSMYQSYDKMVDDECKKKWLVSYQPSFVTKYQNLPQGDSLHASRLFSKKETDAQACITRTPTIT